MDGADWVLARAAAFFFAFAFLSFFITAASSDSSMELTDSDEE
jgi:hypothetical protein